MQILITGVAGFIGYNIANYLLHKSDVKIVGIDSLNNYYSKKLKKDRVKKLSKYKKFSFFHTNILNKKKLEIIFKNKKINLVINLAAQAGVRYSLEKPNEFFDNNIQGFYNLIDVAKKYKIKKIIYASSSSIYGDTKKFPLNENQIVKPKNIYALSKKINEEMAEVFYKQYNISFIGLRFFTVYGQWGRPDMFMMKYLTSSYNLNKKFYLNNYGNHTRDFTYIDDLQKAIKLIATKKNKYLKKNYSEIYNIGGNNPISLKKYVKLIEKNLQTKAIKNFLPLQKGDVKKTVSDVSKIKKHYGFVPETKIEDGIKNFIIWYKNFYKV